MRACWIKYMPQNIPSLRSLLERHKEVAKEQKQEGQEGQEDKEGEKKKLENGRLSLDVTNNFTNCRPGENGNNEEVSSPPLV